MNMLLDTSSHLSANEYFLNHLRAANAPEESSRIQSPSLSHATPGTSRGCTHRRQASHEPCQAIPEAVPDISAAVRPKVTSRMRSVLGLAISDENSGSEEEAISVHKKKRHEIGQAPNS